MADALFLLKTSRPPFWLGSSAFYLIGASTVNLSGIAFWSGLLFCTFPAGLIINGINDIADRESDALNPRKIAAGSVLNNRKARLILICSFIVGLVPIAICITTQHYIASIAMIVLIVTWIVYSCRPFRTKGIPFIDSITNSVGMLLFLIFARSLQKGNHLELFNFTDIVWMLFFGVVAIHALQTLWDIESDMSAHDNTTGSILKLKGTLWFCFTIFCSLLISFHSLHTALNIYLLLAISICIYMIMYPRTKIIYTSTWILLYAFPVLILYFLLFDAQFLTNI